jgi:hypothetical protein
VLGELSATGISIVPFASWSPTTTLWSQLKADMDEFVAGAEDELEHGGGAKRKKDFLIRKYPRGKKKLPKEEAILPSDGPWLRYAAGDALLGIVNAYRGAQVKLVDFDQWYTIPVGDEPERVAHRRWHRDPEDQHVVKVFLYFSDVDEDAGPFEYVQHSAEGFEFGDLWPWGESERYPPTEELERRSRLGAGACDRARRNAGDLRHERLPPRRLRAHEAADPLHAHVREQEDHARAARAAEVHGRLARRRLSEASRFALS